MANPAFVRIPAFVLQGPRQKKFIFRASARKTKFLLPSQRPRALDILFALRDDLKRDLRQILLLFVSDDDLKRDLSRILLLFVRGDGVNS